MKIKHLGLALIISAFSITALPVASQASSHSAEIIAKGGSKGSSGGSADAFSAADCPKSSLYKTDRSKAKAPEDIKTPADCNLAKTEYDAMDVAVKIINVIVGLVGIIAVAVIVIGGITFATSQGDPSKASKAKNTILYGVVGLVISMLAFAIVNFVLKSVF